MIPARVVTSLTFVGQNLMSYWRDKMNHLEMSLERNGFRECKTCRPIVPHEHASAMWQIRIRSASGATLYFVNAYFYEKLMLHLKDAIEFEAILYPSQKNLKHWITLEFHGCDQEQDIHTAMEFFLHAYDSLWCQPDPHNQ